MILIEAVLASTESVTFQDSDINGQEQSEAMSCQERQQIECKTL